MTTSTEPQPTTVRRAATDATLAGASAVESARAAAVEVAGQGSVGEHLGAFAEEDRLVTHEFTCLDKGYRGWRWAVTVSRPPRGRTVTVDEAVLLPGPDSLLAPAWVPWSERLKPGDLGVGDLLVTEADDDRLEPGYGGRAGDETVTDLLDELDRVAVWELGLGRARVLSPIGRDDAVDRWYSGDHGPDAAIAQAAPATCSTCGFLVPLAGLLRRSFGVCANEYSPSDGRVVSVDHGCGAHSEVALTSAALGVAAPVLDEIGYDLITVPPAEAAPAGHTPGSVDDEAPGEDLGHS